MDDKTAYVGISLDSSLPKQPQRGTDRDKHEAQRRGENSEASQCIASILACGANVGEPRTNPPKAFSCYQQYSRIHLLSMDGKYAK